jgi:UDP-N-acetylmuramate dehydrogenase
MLAGQGGPDGKSVGSFFKNPIVPPATLTRIAAALDRDPNTIPHWPAPDGQIKLPAAWLLDQSGFHKGLTMGGAGISSRHTLALINRNHATFAEITTLRDRIIKEVQNRFQIQLEQEPVQIGK